MCSARGVHQSCEAELKQLTYEIFKNARFPLKLFIPRVICIECREELMDELASAGLYVDECNLNISLGISDDWKLLHPSSKIIWEIFAF